MEVAKIFVGSTSGIARDRKRIPAGKTVSGLTVSVEFTDPVWEDMIKTVVFRGTDSRITEFDGKTAVIPWEVLTEPGVRIWFGIFGHNPDTGMQLPLIEVDIGVTERATDPLADPGTDPTLPIWAQLQQEIEQLKQAGVSEEKIAQIVADYLTKNPPTVSEKDPTVPDWAKNKEKPKYTAQEVGALSQDSLDGAVNDALSKAKESGEFDGKDGAPGQDYVLTDADKAEIAELAADLVEVPEHSGGNAGFVVQDTEPEDTSVLWVDPTDNSEDGFQEAVNAALAQAKESGEFDGPPGQPGKDGKDGVVAVTGATVGQTVKISAVDENGVPTAWEPAAFPEGGGGGGNKEWVCLLNTTTTEDVLTLNITKDIEGNAFSVDEVYIRLHLINPDGGGTILINLGTSASTRLMAQGLFTSRTQAYGIINIYKKANGWIADHSISHESVQGGMSRPYLSVSTEIVPSITSLFISTTSENSFFAVGSTIEIWGAKA